TIGHEVDGPTIIDCMCACFGQRFFAENRVIRDADHVTGDFQGNSPKQILDAVLKNQSLTYEIVDKIIVIRSKAKPPTPSTNSSQTRRPNVPKSSLPVSESKKEPMVELSEKMLLTLISEITVRGVVKDEKGEVLPGVSILIKGTQQGTVTG